MIQAKGFEARCLGHRVEARKRIGHVAVAEFGPCQNQTVEQFARAASGFLIGDKTGVIFLLRLVGDQGQQGRHGFRLGHQRHIIKAVRP